jgi:hypothetical protein
MKELGDLPLLEKPDAGDSGVNISMGARLIIP